MQRVHAIMHPHPATEAHFAFIELFLSGGFVQTRFFEVLYRKLLPVRQER